MKTLAFEAATEQKTNTQYSNQTAIIIKIRLFTKPGGGGGGGGVVVVGVVFGVVVWSTRGLREVYMMSTRGLHEVYTRSTRGLHEVYMRST